MSKGSQLCWLAYVLAKASIDMILTAHLVGIRCIDGIAYWETILSVKCRPRTVVRGNVANSSHVRKLDLYIKRCGLWIFV